MLEVNSSTDEIIINADKKDLDLIKQTKIKAVKILSSLPINYILEIKE